jgi:hypothetical protein
MTTGENAVPVEETQDSGIQQVPLVFGVQETPGVGEAREQLLQAIAREAQHVTDKQAGNASGPLEQLARAYALVTQPAVALPQPAGESAAVPISSRAEWGVE